MQAAKNNAGRTTALLIGSAVAAAATMLAIVFALFASSVSVVATPPARGLYVIYYGPLVNTAGKMSEQAQEILQTKPSIAIVVYHAKEDSGNASANVIKQFKQAGIQVLTYTWTGYGSRDLEAVKADINSQLDAGADGIFVDEVTNLANDRDLVYYSSIYHAIKDYDKTRLVVMNPGNYRVSQGIMAISDILSLEGDWVYSSHIPWKQQYTPSRFMGVSSNEYCNPACVSQSNAENMTMSAWHHGIGYHFATDRYTDLPGWYSSYMSDLQKLSAP